MILHDSLLLSETQAQREKELVLVARQGNMLRVKELLSTDLSINAVDEFGMTPLMLLAAQGLDEGVELLLDNPSCLVNKRTSSMVVRETGIRFNLNRNAVNFNRI